MNNYGAPNVMYQQQQQQQPRQQHMTSPHMQSMSHGQALDQQHMLNMQRTGISSMPGMNMGGMNSIGGNIGSYSSVGRGFGGNEIHVNSGQAYGNIGARMGSMVPPGSGFGRSNGEDFAIEKEDFPALPGSNNNKSDQRSTSESAKESESVSSQAMNQGILVSSDDLMNGVNGDNNNKNTVDNSNKQSNKNNSIEEKYGLTGLIDILRNTDKDNNCLAIGMDLTQFGLNLNSERSLYSTFSSPFTNHTLSRDAQFRTPGCYMMHPPSLKAEHITKFQLETLFYMFYSMPKDLLQTYAALELYRREWKYHGELKIWLKLRSNQELMSHPSVQYVYFDCTAWEPRLFTNSKGNITAGILNEDEIRIKAPQQTTTAAS